MGCSRFKYFEDKFILQSQIVFIPIDHIILNTRRELREIGAESPDPYNQITVLFRMNLRVSQYF